MQIVGRRPLLSIVVPCRDGADDLVHCLEAVGASDVPREWWELIVVDDASRDASAEVAARYADTVLRLPIPHGPAYARNRGAEVANGELLVFIDADVCVHADAIRLLAETFRLHPEASAVIGAYDDAPPAPGLVSQYRNLLRHHYHHRVDGAVDHFWAGCGAIRRSVFLAAGMYNEWHLSRAQLEDELLGRHLRALGHTILLRTAVRATHRKRWTLRGAIGSDLFARGVMHTRLVAQAARFEGKGVRGWLRSSERVSELFVALTAVGLAGAVAAPSIGWASAALVPFAAWLAVNAPVLGYFRRLRGLRFALGVTPLHWLCDFASGLGRLAGWLLRHTVGEPRPHPTIEAMSEVGARTWPPIPVKPPALPAPVIAGSTTAAQAPSRAS